VCGTTIPLKWRNKLLVPDLPEHSVPGSTGPTADEVFLELLDAATQQGRNISDSKNAGNYAPKTFAASPKANRYNLRQLAAAMQRLFDAGEIRMEQYGRKHDARTRIVRVSALPAPDSDAVLCGGCS
jgi:hypothetical protein